MHSLQKSAVPTVVITLSAILALTTPSAVGAADRAEVVIGEVTVEQVPGLGIEVIVDSFDNSSRDGVAEYVYVLQTDAPLAIGLPMHLDLAQLVFNQDHLVVVSLEEPWALGLYLDELDRGRVERLIGGIQEDYFGVARPELSHLAAGYGLARHSGHFPLPLDGWLSAKAKSRLGRKSMSSEVTSQETCTSGGPGASSASLGCINDISDASITCRDGYYACCYCEWYGQAKCKCVEEGSGGDRCPPCEPFDEN